MNEKKGQSLFLIPQRRPPASPFFFHAGGQRAARPAPRQSRRHRDFALAAVEGPTGNVNQSTGDAVHVRSKGDRVRKRNGRRGRGGDPRRLQLCGDEVRRERNLHRRVSKKRGFIGASAPSFFIRNVRPADSCYIRLTRLLDQVVSQGLQFLHNRRRRAADRQRRRRHRQGGRAGNPVENVAPGWSARSRPRLTTSSAMVPPPTRTYLRSRALATTDAPIHALIATDAHHPHPATAGAHLPRRTAGDAHPSTLHHCTTAPPQPARIIHTAAPSRRPFRFAPTPITRDAASSRSSRDPQPR